MSIVKAIPQNTHKFLLKVGGNFKKTEIGAMETTDPHSQTFEEYRLRKLLYTMKQYSLVYC